MRKLTAVLAICALAPFALAACGGDDEEEPATQATTEEPAGGGGGKTVAISAAPDNSFAFEQDELTAPAGSVTFEFENPASLGHDFCLEDGGDLGCTETISESSDTLEVELDAGEYTFYCSVSGHREGGMEGDLTVDGGGPG
jgi:plastocyanin